MKAKDILDKIQNHKGQIMPCVIQNTVKTLKGVSAVVVKRNSCYIVAGIDYANRKEVREAIEAGQRGEVQPLPWGTWGEYPYIIKHTPKGANEVNEYIRLYPPTEIQAQTFNLKSRVEFFADGRPIDRQTAIQYCGTKAESSDSVPMAITPNVASIVSIG